MIVAEKAENRELVLSIFTGGADTYSLLGDSNLTSGAQARWSLITNLPGNLEEVRVAIPATDRQRLFRVGLQ